MIYAKALPRSEAAPVLEVPTYEPAFAPEPAPAWSGALDDARTEWTIRVVALPVALLVAWALVHVGPLRMLARVFLSMWIHELGHASTAWLCGFAAFPGPWFTPMSCGREPLLSVVLAGALGYGAWRAWKSEKAWLSAVFATLLVAQAIGTLALSDRTARMVFIFGGDAGALVWGTAGLLTLYAPQGSHLQRSWLRWGFLVIGAVTFADVLATWIAANGDYAEIPYGQNEGSGLSDASRLSDDFGWGGRELIDRHLRVALACGAVLVGAYVAGLRSAARKLP